MLNKVYKWIWLCNLEIEEVWDVNSTYLCYMSLSCESCMTYHFKELVSTQAPPLCNIIHKLTICKKSERKKKERRETTRKIRKQSLVNSKIMFFMFFLSFHHVYTNWNWEIMIENRRICFWVCFLSVLVCCNDGSEFSWLWIYLIGEKSRNHA